VISEEVGTAKPAAGIFEYAFEKMGNPVKKDVLIVGDSLTSDMAGGINFGIDTCWCNFDSQRAGNPDASLDRINFELSYEINNLNELIEIVTGS